MINATHEPLLNLNEAARIVGKHVATVYRWSTAGIRGIVLETLQVGGSRRTSREAIQRFCQRLTEEIGPRCRPRPPAGIGAQRAALELERHGI